MKQQATNTSEQQHHTHSAATREAPIASGLNDFIDARDSAITQRKMADMIAQSPVVVAQRAFSTRINNSPRMVAQRKHLDNLFGDAVQLQEDDEAEPIQGKFETTQRLEVDEEQALQPKIASELPAQGEQAPASQPNNTGLPDNLKSGIESLSGMAMDHVKVHYNSSQPAQLNALAYAQGSDIHVAPGQEKHLPHEAWHVVQQAQGRVQATTQMKEGVPINDDQGLEREADVMGAKAAAAGRLVTQTMLSQGRSMPGTAHPQRQLTGGSGENGRLNLRSPADRHGSRAAGHPVQRQLELIAGRELVPDAVAGYKALYGETTTRQLFLVQESGKVYLAITAPSGVLPIRDTGYHIVHFESVAQFLLYAGDPLADAAEVVNKTMPAQAAPAVAVPHATSLMTKVPAHPPPETPKVLLWTGDHYAPGSVSFSYDVYRASDARAQARLPLLREWIPVAEAVGVTDGRQVIENIIEVIEGADDDDLVLFAKDGATVLGVATYRLNDRPELAHVAIPAQPGDFIYVQYRAANPETQVPADARVTGAPGGVGQALYAGIERHGLPVFTYTENAVSQASATRAGYTKLG